MKYLPSMVGIFFGFIGVYYKIAILLEYANKNVDFLHFVK